MKITDNLYQGGSYPIEDNTLPEFINAVVAVGNTFKKLDGRLCRHIPLIEIGTEYIEELRTSEAYYRFSSADEIMAAIECVNNLVSKGYTVYLHCDAGVCRSVGIAAGYLVRSGQCETLLEAYKKVGGRFEPEWNPFERDLGKLIETKYWTQFKEYIDLHNYFYTYQEWKAMQLDKE